MQRETSSLQNETFGTILPYSLFPINSLSPLSTLVPLLHSASSLHSLGSPLSLNSSIQLLLPHPNLPSNPVSSKPRNNSFLTTSPSPLKRSRPSSSPFLHSSTPHSKHSSLFLNFDFPSHKTSKTLKSSIPLFPPPLHTREQKNRSMTKSFEKGFLVNE